MPDDSMAPLVLKDDILTLKDVTGTPSPGLCLVRLSGATVLRRISADLLGSLFISADSRPEERIALDTAKAKVIARAIELTRKL